MDQDCGALPQTPDDDTALASPSSFQQKHGNYSSESSDNLDKESRAGTPSSPNKNFLNRSSSGPGSGGTLDSLSPGADILSRKCKILLVVCVVCLKQKNKTKCLTVEFFFSI